MKNVLKENIKISAPINALNQAVIREAFTGQKLDSSTLHRYGIFILKDYFDVDMIQNLRNFYDRGIENRELVKDPYHKTQVAFGSDSDFANILQTVEFKKLGKGIWGDDGFSIDFMRLVKKDHTNTDPVFPHQDSTYNIGNYDAYSIFIPLSECGVNNGGLKFWPGTHNFGHLGDAGAIDISILPAEYPSLQPTVVPGDAIIMHAGTWHASSEFIAGEPRVYLEFATRSLCDPAAKIIICGQDKREWVIQTTVDFVFTGSREQRIRQLYKKLDEQQQVAGS